MKITSNSYLTKHLLNELKYLWQSYTVRVFGYKDSNQVALEKRFKLILQVLFYESKFIIVQILELVKHYFDFSNWFINVTERAMHSYFSYYEDSKHKRKYLTHFAAVNSCKHAVDLKLYFKSSSICWE